MRNKIRTVRTCQRLTLVPEVVVFQFEERRTSVITLSALNQFFLDFFIRTGATWWRGRIATTPTMTCVALLSGFNNLWSKIWSSSEIFKNISSKTTEKDFLNHKFISEIAWLFLQKACWRKKFNLMRLFFYLQAG